MAAAAAADEMAPYEPVEFPPAAGVGPPPASSSQAVSTAAPKLLSGDHHGGRLAAAAAQVMRGRPPWRTSARRPKRPERVLGSAELGQEGDRRTLPCCWRSTGVGH